MADYRPKPEHKFTFGLWTVGNIGRDPFGEPTRHPISPVAIVHLLAEVGAWGVNLHDNDLVPIDATPAERDKIVAEFKAAMDETGIVCPMATTNLFAHPAFKDGAFTSNDPAVRAYALQKTMASMDLGAELGRRFMSFGAGGKARNLTAPRTRLTASSAFATPSTSSANTPKTRTTATASRWNQSPMNRAATFISRPSAACSASSPR